MPDWSYQTVFKPVLFRLPAGTARDLSLRAMGTLAQVPLGGRVIDFLGHMRPDVRLERTIAGITFASPLGLGARLDPELRGLDALSRFGFGFVEIGPVSLRPKAARPIVERRVAEEAISISDRIATLGLSPLVQTIASRTAQEIPLLARLTVDADATVTAATADGVGMIDRLSPHVRIFAIDTLSVAMKNGWTEKEWREHCQQLAAHAMTAQRPLLVCIAAGDDAATVQPLVRVAREAGFMGLQISGELEQVSPAVLIGKPARSSALAMVKSLRSDLRDDSVIVASGGVHEPADALKLFEAGADLLQIDSGLVYSGPGLVKRVNDALLFATAQRTIIPATTPVVRTVERDWFWSFLMGLGMLLGGLVAIAIASTRVVLSYDESFVCMSREQLDKLNGRLLSFMCHDRVSLSGTMLAIGAIYVFLSYFGMRAGLHWARVAVLSSASMGFVSFFLFLGFGYFDPFHAFVTTVLLQFLLLSVIGQTGVAQVPQWPNLYNDWRWKWSQWGHLLLIAHGAALIVAGSVISYLGATTVFVPEDLEFMQTTAEILNDTSPKLIPLVAHDRASFGGMILCTGIATLLATLWGFQQGRSWLWWMMAVAGAIAYVPAIGVHYAVGYVNWWHLLPAYCGAAVLIAGLALSWPYLCRSQRQAEAEWCER